MGESWWVVIIELKDHSVVKYASKGYNRVNAKFNAESSKDYRDWMVLNSNSVVNVGVIKSMNAYSKTGFIQT